MAQSAGIGSLVKWGLIGLVGYWVYENYFAATPAAVAAPASTPPATIPPATVSAPPTTVTPATTPAATTPPPSASVLDQIYSNIVAKAPSGALMNADQWGWYLNNELAALGKPAAPDPVPIFGLDRSQPLPTVTLAQWWTPMAAALKSQLGLSGLGMFAGLGALYGRRY